MSTKVDYKKDYKELYLPPTKPVLLTVPKIQFFMLSGKGDPNGPEFAEVIQALYSLSFGIKMLPKSGSAPEGYHDYTVFPLEGVWDLETAPTGPVLDKSALVYTVMIRQPEFVTPELAEDVQVKTMKKKSNPMLERVQFGSCEEGLCVQMMHIGAFDDEPASFAQMADFCAQNGLRRIGHAHREIYLSDPRKTAAEKLKTVLRYQVERG